jgi:pyruvate/2-oxoglutarate/acetoin dehydrogenase E1 component
VLFLEHKRLYSTKGDDPASEIAPLGRATTVRAGSDVTIVSLMKGVHDALAAGETLATEGIDAEVIDLRCLRPLDLETVLASVAHTNRLVLVEEGPQLGGWGAGLLGAVAQEALGSLDDAFVVATGDTPVPYSPPLEEAFLPGPARIVGAIRERLGVADVDVTLQANLMRR